MKTHHLTLAGIALAVASGAIVVGCSSSGGGLAEPTCDASGYWYIAASVSTSSPACSDENGTIRSLYPTLSQSGNTLTVNVSGEQFSGTISGSTISWSGSYPEDMGTTTERLTGTVNDTCTSVSGSTTWSWTDGVYSCTGTSSFYGSK